jgi:uncharacterized protein (TIGR02145 family)
MYGKYDGNGTDDYGFSALPGGFRNFNNGDFGYAGYGGYWWTSEEEEFDSADFRKMEYNYDYVGEWAEFTSYAISVRCVQNGLI